MTRLILLLDNSKSMAKVYPGCLRACADAAACTNKAEVICYLFSTRLIQLYHGPPGRRAARTIVREGRKRQCNGKTAYYDFVSCVLGKYQQRGSGGDTTLVIATDGMDNASRFVDGPDCTRRLLIAQKRSNWDVTFIGLRHAAGIGRDMLIRSATASGVHRPAMICTTTEFGAAVREASGCSEPYTTSSSCRTNSHESPALRLPSLSRRATVSSTKREDRREFVDRNRHAARARSRSAAGVKDSSIMM